MKKKRRDITDIFIAAALVAAVMAALLLTADGPGMAWDEGNDIRMAKGAVEWFRRLGEPGARPFSRAEIETYWGYEWKQHPAVTRTVFAAVYMLRGDLSGAPAEFSEWKAYRLGPFIIFSLIVAGVYLFAAARLGSRWAGLAAAAALALMPRMFGHAHFVETDLMLCAVYFAAAAAFLKGLESKWGALAFGVLMGLLPAVKFSGLFACAPFFIYGFAFERKKVWMNLLAAAVIAPAVFYLVQPMYWHTPFASLAEYLRHFTNPKTQATITTMYFGGYYPKSPPWSYPWVITALVIPLPTLVLAAVGGASAFCLRAKQSAKQDHEKQSEKQNTKQSAKQGLAKRFLRMPVPALRPPGLFAPESVLFFVIMNALFMLALFSLPRAAIYDGERLLMPVFPFWALLAGTGFNFIVGRFSGHSGQNRPVLSQRDKNRDKTGDMFHVGALLAAPLQLAAFLIFIALAAVPVYRARPYYLCYYNALIGGTKGAERHGMEVMYWGEAFTPQLAARMNAALPRGARITTIGYFSGNFDYFKQMGLLRQDFVTVDYGREADFVLAFNRPGALDPYSTYLIKKAPPIIPVDWNGIRLAGVYILKPALRFLK